MANCIAIDASSETCSVSLVVNAKVTTTSSETPKSHAKNLLPFVHELLTAQAVTLADVDFIACCKGPGSFTGLRIGLGIAQGLAFGAKKPMVGVSSLEAMARTAKISHPSADLVVSLLDARMGEIYWSVTAFSSAAISYLADPKLNAVSDVNDELAQLINNHHDKSVCIAGAAANLLDTSWRQTEATIDTSIAPDAAMIATIAIEKWNAGAACAAQDFELEYLRNSVSWNKRKRIRT